MSNGWLAETLKVVAQHGIFHDTSPDWAMFTNPNGVAYHESLSDLRHFMCNSEQLHREILYLIHSGYWDDDQRKQAYASFCWMMAIHAAAWERRGWQFEPNEVEILEWII